MKVLVTGASGRVGANLTQALIQQGHTVRAFVFPGDASRMHKLDSFNVEIQYGELGDYDRVAQAVQGMDVVYHIAAAMIGPFDNAAYFDTNAKGTFNVIEAVRTHAPNLHRFIYASTDAVYPVFPDDEPGHIATEDMNVEPSGMYPFTKWVGERLSLAYHKQYGIPVVAFRFAWVMGAGEIADPGYAKFLWLSKTLEDYKKRPQLSAEEEQALAILESLWPGEERLLLTRFRGKYPLRMHFVDVRDLVKGLLLGIEKDEAVGEVFNLPGPRMLAADEVVPYLSQRLNIPYVEADLPLRRPYRELSWAKAHRILGYTPQHDLDSMVDLALAMQSGERVEVVPTGIPYGVAS
jgi:nucleoside-diphosphate-sugar epimerase